jgi:hypothetical protein
MTYKDLILFLSPMSDFVQLAKVETVKINVREDFFGH